VCNHTEVRVYHFLSATYALADIERRRIKVSQLSALNDPFELLASQLLTRRERQRFNSFRRKIERQYGVLCFSRSWSNPLLWSHYGDKHRGMCLGFEVNEKMLEEVNYRRSRQLLNPGVFSRQTQSGPTVCVSTRLTATSS